MNFTETKHTSAMSNIGGSFKGIIFGVLMILVAIYLLWTNEGKAVHVAKALDEGAGTVVSVHADKINKANEGMLIHVSGLATTTDTVRDEEFGVKANALKLIRNVELYQWKEKAESKSKKNIGGSSDVTTEYSYVKEWTSAPVPSDKFKQKEGHSNIVPYSYKNDNKQARNVNLGAFSLTEDLLLRISTGEKLPVKTVDSSHFKNAVINDGMIYLGSKNLLSPEVGDVRISYSAVYPKQISLVAKQVGNSFEEYIASNDESVLLLKEGISSADNMFKKAIEANTFKTWMIRWLGFFMIFIGFRRIFKPLVAIGSIIPFVGNMISMGVGIISFALAVPIAAVVIALAWFAYRPMVSGIILGSALLIYFYYRSRGKKKADVLNKIKTNADDTAATLNPGGERMSQNK